ncbi:hypothetical protein [Streptomyces fulvorobeus]|uniref:hypothetical protein n=1 Tax=Streptomyces fulvorobeus TaxID=284028 RepID=UPI001567A920|nr:hypothetical protein [Streptomyces fulvorobeus]
MLAQRQVLLLPGGSDVVEEFGRRPLRVARVAGQQPVGGVRDVFGGVRVVVGVRVDVQGQEVADTAPGLDGDGFLARRVGGGDGEVGVVEDRRGEGLGEGRRGQGVVRGRFGVMEGEVEVVARQRGSA